MTEEAATGLMTREDALEDLERRAEKGESIRNHHRDDEPILCQAYVLLAGLRSSGLPFGYFIQNGKAHVITGQPDAMGIQGVYATLQVEKNGEDLTQMLIQTASVN